MNDPECVATYNRLSKMLEEKGLDWVVAQVKEQIRIGKTTRREIETLREGKETLFSASNEDYTGWLKKGPKATFPVTVEYQPRERLELLIEAIKQTVVNTADMEHEIVSLLEKDEKGPKRIDFFSDDAELKPKTIDRRSIGKRWKGAMRLDGLLEDLRREIRK